MKILDFIEKTKLGERNECEKAKLLCFFHYKETGELVFPMSLVSNLFVQCGFTTPNTSRLKNNLTKGKEKVFVESKGKPATIEFVSAILQSMEKNYGILWQNYITIESCSEIIDEKKFVGKRKYLDQLIYQINHSYAKGEWFTTDDVLCLLTDIFGEPATSDQVNGVFKREKMWFKLEKVDGKSVKRKLLNQGIDFAMSLTTD